MADLFIGDPFATENKPMPNNTELFTGDPFAVGITQTPEWPKMEDTTDTATGKRSPVYIDSATGATGERQFGQFIPSSSHVSLSESPESKRRAYAAKLIKTPEYRSGMAEFIRKEAGRNILREAANDIPLAEPLLDTKYGVYNDPIHPERTVEKVLGFQPTIGVLPSISNAVSRVVSNPTRTINNALYGAAGLGQNLLETTAGYNKDKTWGNFGKELAEPIKTSLGLADVETAYETGKTDFSYPKARAMYEEDLANTALIASGTLKGGMGTISGVADFGRELAKTKPNQVLAAKNVSKTLAETMPRTGEGKKYTGKIDANRAINEARAINYLHENPDIMPTSDIGEPIKVTDLNTATQFEAIENGINKLLQQQNEAMIKAGNSGIRYSTQPLIDFWTGVIKDTEKGSKGKDIIKHANDEIAALKQKGKSYSLDGALNDLTIINNELRFGQAPISNSVKGVMGKEATLRRQMLDDAVMKASDAGDPYLADIRRNMGSLIELRDRNGKLLSKIAKSDPSIKGSLLHDYGIAQIAYGVISHNPASIAKGATIIGSKWLYKKLKDPDFKIKRMHQDYEKRRESFAPPRMSEGMIEKPVTEGSYTLLQTVLDPENISAINSNPQDIIPGRNKLGLEEGGISSTIQREQTVLNPEESLPPTGRTDSTLGEGPLAGSSDISMESGAVPRSGPYIANPEILPGRWPQQQEMIPNGEVPRGLEEGGGKYSPLNETELYDKLSEMGYTPDEIIAYSESMKKEAYANSKIADIAKKVGVPAAAITAYMAMDDEQRKSVGLLGAIGMTTMVGKQNGSPKPEPKFYSALKRSLNEIVPPEKGLVGTHDVQLKGSPEKRIQTPQGEKIIPAREGGTVKGKGVEQIFFELAKKTPEITEAELRASGVLDVLRKAKQVVNRELRAGEAEAGVVTVKQLSDAMEQNLPKLGEDVYGENPFTMQYAEADGQRLMTLKKIRDKIVESDRAKGVQTMPSYAMDVVKLQYRSGFKHLKDTYPELTPLFEKWNAENKVASELFDKKQEASGKQPQFSGYQAIKSQEGVIPGSYTEKFVTVELPNIPDFKSYTTRNGEQYFKDENTGTKVVQGGVGWNVEDADGMLWKNSIMSLPEAIKIAEEVVTSGRAGVESRLKWQDEHTQYSDTKNPMVRVRYDDVVKPDGRKVRRLQEIQEPKQVNTDSKSAESKAKEEYSKQRGVVRKWEELNPQEQSIYVEMAKKQALVPQELATRAIDMGIKQLIADAKRDGMDGIEWATGEQQRALYDNALRNVADEARYNPETQELTIYKNGQPSNAQSAIPVKVKPENIADYIGKSGAERLLSSDIRGERFQVMQRKDGSFSVADNYSNSYIKEGIDKEEAQILSDKFNADPSFSNDNQQYIANDLNMDAAWPSKLYGDFVKPEYQIRDTSIGYIVKDKQGNQLEKPFKTRDGAEKFIQSKGDFNYTATVPRLLKKYGKGEFGTSKTQGKNGRFTVEDSGQGTFSVYDNVRKEMVDAGYSTRESAQADIDAMWGDKDFETGTSQPVMWFTKETPTSFPMYEGTTGIFKMLQEEIAKEGGKASGVAKVALKYGVPASLIATYLKVSDSERKKLLPKMKGITNAIEKGNKQEGY